MNRPRLSCGRRMASSTRIRTPQELMEALMREVIALAQVQGINLTEHDIDEWIPFLHGLSPREKRPCCKISKRPKNRGGDLWRKVVELGKKYNVPTPVNEPCFASPRAGAKRELIIAQGAPDNNN